MNQVELATTHGGIVPWIIPTVTSIAIGAVVGGWADFKTGFAEAYAHQTELNQ